MSQIFRWALNAAPDLQWVLGSASFPLLADKFWGYLSPVQICTRRQHCHLSQGLLVPSQGQLLRLFFLLSYPVLKLGPPHPSPLRDADPTCQALPCAELYYVSALLTPKSPCSVKNVPSGLWLTLPLSSKCFLSATRQAVARAKQNFIVSPSFLQPICLHPQNGLSATAARYTKGPELFTGAAFPSSSPHSTDKTPATGKYSCQEYPSQGNKCFATPLQLACTPRRGEALDFSVLLAVC